MLSTGKKFIDRFWFEIAHQNCEDFQNNEEFLESLEKG